MDGLFKIVGITGRKQHTYMASTIKYLIEVLDNLKIQWIIDQKLIELLENQLGFGDKHNKSCMLTEMADCCDVVMVVGGDGSFLSAARKLVGSNKSVPLIGINHGRLGFLADICHRNIQIELEQIFKGEYLLEQRFLIEMSLEREGHIIATHCALNDIVLHPKTPAKILDFSLTIDYTFVCDLRADGIIVATPTGSTAYALSAGGPILHHSMDAMILVPLSPHMLTHRPLAINGDSVVQLEVTSDRLHTRVTCDGQVHFSCMEGDIITIKKKAFKVTIMHPKNYDFYQVCRTKLGWSEIKKKFSIKE